MDWTLFQNREAGPYGYLSARLTSAEAEQFMNALPGREAFSTFTYGYVATYADHSPVIQILLSDGARTRSVLVRGWGSVLLASSGLGETRWTEAGGGAFRVPVSAGKSIGEPANATESPSGATAERCMCVPGAVPESLAAMYLALLSWRRFDAVPWKPVWMEARMRLVGSATDIAEGVPWPPDLPDAHHPYARQVWRNSPFYGIPMPADHPALSGLLSGAGEYPVIRMNNLVWLIDVIAPRLPAQDVWLSDD